MASSASLAILQISNSQQSPVVVAAASLGSVSTQSSAPVATPAFCLFFSRLQESVCHSPAAKPRSFSLAAPSPTVKPCLASA
ncbi:hypothetical protein KSP40_PGU022636 [Platanthera guangdongensis]|uniref:Secreted protein n=1 Tax=Platanthera guangdongensis TaxID=2320717 RepID=A0ABR2MD23_9ASPA